MTRNTSCALRNAALTAVLATLGSQAGATLVGDGKPGDAAAGFPKWIASGAPAERNNSLGLVDDSGNAMGNGQIWFGIAGERSQLRTTNKANVTAPAAKPLPEATSFARHLKNVHAKASTNSSTNPRWLKEVGHEHQFVGLWNPWAKTVATTTGSASGTATPVPGVLQLSDVQTPQLKVGPLQASEPGSLALIVSALAALGWYTRRRRTDGPAPSTRVVAS